MKYIILAFTVFISSFAFSQTENDRYKAISTGAIGGFYLEKKVDTIYIDVACRKVIEVGFYTTNHLLTSVMDTSLVTDQLVIKSIKAERTLIYEHPINAASKEKAKIYVNGMRYLSDVSGCYVLTPAVNN